MLPQSESFYKSLAEQIKFERIKRKRSQQGLADHLGLSRTSIINLESGRHKPSIYQLLQIANYLSIDYAALIPFKGKKSDRSKEKISIDVKKAIIDYGELDKSSKTAVSNFLTDIKK